MDLEFTREKIETYFFDKLTNSHPILKALNSGKLIIFVGAGMSVHLGLPSWREFAIKYLEIIYKNSQTTSMNFKTKEGLKTEDTKKILSLCEYIGKKNLLDNQLEGYYKSWFETDKSNVLNGRLYEKLYRLNAIYLTTNYDNALDLIAEDGPIVGNNGDKSKTPDNGYKKVYYDISEFTNEILKPQNVIHVHGSVKDISTMIISYGDYIKRYGLNGNLHENKRDVYSDFMTEIFSQKDYVVLFMGYGLEEIEILQFLFEGAIKDSKSYCNNRYLLLPCFSDDYLKISYLSDYYKNNFGVSVIPCNMSEKGYNILEDVLDHLLILSKGTYQENDEVKELKEGLKAIEEMFL
ncbi:SIR2 family protein [Neobacillus cucumis]|uniref:SIR2 family protein n=1 Tax=Neobacillus cucumis TaxID=1740721 RepID=UPI0028532447|nr:SIR2 family protein [Neobacillus cucumis]MDR4945310.1 SIR2 family protein [Neobacillus cucumis]